MLGGHRCVTSQQAVSESLPVADRVSDLVVSQDEVKVNWNCFSTTSAILTSVSSLPSFLLESYKPERVRANKHIRVLSIVELIKVIEVAIVFTYILCYYNLYSK